MALDPNTNLPADSLPENTPSSAPDLGQNAVQPVGPDANQVQNPNAIVGQDERKGSGVGGALADVFQTIAGGKKTVYNQTENGPVPVEVNLAPGEIARHILASALVGLAGGLKAKGQPGNAGANAAAAGFEANQERADKQKQQAKSDAQDQFKNKQITDEAILRKAENARLQQRSMELTQQHVQEMQRGEQALAQGKVDEARRATEFDQGQADRFASKIQNGWQKLKFPDGREVPEFEDRQSFMDFIHANPKLAISPGSYDTSSEIDPHTGRHVILTQPKNYDTVQWLGVELGPDGQPKQDTNGNMIPNGEFKDASGKAVAPAGQMTMKQLEASQDRLLELRNKELTGQEILARLRDRKEQRVKDKIVQTANDHLNLADGDINAINPKTGEYYVSKADRNVLKNGYRVDGTAALTAMNQLSKQLRDLDPKDPEYENTKALLETAQNTFYQNQLDMNKLQGGDPNSLVRDTVNQLRKDFTKPGGFDEAGASKAVEALKLNSGLKQSIRQKLLSPDQIADATPAQIDAGIAAIQKLPREQQETAIRTSTKYSSADKQKILSKLQGGTSTAPNTDLSSIGTDKTLLRNQQGWTQIIPNNVVDSFVKSHPGYQVVGTGTQQDAPIGQR